MKEVTFIIPTMGRSTLKRATDSLKAQINPNWKALIVYDGRFKDEAVVYEDSRIMSVLPDDYGHAGILRNHGIDLVSTDWIAFLDDDDWVKNTYVEKLQSYSNNNPALDVIIFTYQDVINKNTVPHKNLRVIEECKVGISFAVKTDFINTHGIRFTPFAIEDFRFLDECRNKGANILITHNLQYYVGGRGGWLRKD